MRTSVIVNEFAKMRHLHVVLLAALLAVVLTGFSLATGVMNPDFDRTHDGAWNALLAAFGGAAALAAPLLVALLASRQTDVEHTGGGWLPAATSGVSPGALCRAKLLALSVLATTAIVAASAALSAAGFLLGVTAPWPVLRWVGCTAAIVVVSLVLLAVHVLLAARVENQLVGIGIGLLGTVVAMIVGGFPAWVAHVTPWGYYSLAAAAGYAGADLVPLQPSHPSIVGLALVAAIVFGVLTRRLDRQEV